MKQAERDDPGLEVKARTEEQKGKLDRREELNKM